MPSNRLVNASQAPRCQHIKVNGMRCGSPARHGRPCCCFHDSAARRNGEFVLPIVEDATSLQLALNKIMQALVDKLIDQKTASTLLYGLQIALTNLKQLKGEQRLDELERRLRAKHEQEERAASDLADHPESQPAKIPPAAAITNRQSPIANETHAPDESRFDIEACAADVRERAGCFGDGSAGPADRKTDRPTDLFVLTPSSAAVLPCRPNGRRAG